MNSRMTAAARWTEIAVGVFFLVSAAAKAFDMDAFGVQISAYNVVKDAGVVRASAWFALVAEVVLGGLLVSGARLGGFTHFASAGMIAVYSGLIVYAWQFHGLTDCGCLGAWITMGPVESLIKNGLLIAAIAFAWQGTRHPDSVASPVFMQRRRLAAATLALAVGIIAGVSGGKQTTVTAPPNAAPTDGSKPYAQFVFEADGQSYDLGTGEYLVAFLNATCEHCKASVPGLNKLMEMPSLPPLVALMMGNEAQLADFQQQTQPLFSAHLIPPLLFMEFIGTVPPRLSHIREGVGVRHWDWEDEVPEGEILVHFNPPRE